MEGGEEVAVSARVVPRRCPDCGETLHGSPGVAWFTCGRCALAFDPFASPARREATERVAGAEGPVLPFWRFRLTPAPDAVGEPPPEPVSGIDPLEIRRTSFTARRRGGRPDVPPVAWVFAVRVPGIQTHGDAGERLTDLAWDPETRPAPVPVPISHGPEAARRILFARLGVAAGSEPGVTGRTLVGVPCADEGRLVREPVSGLVYPKGLLLPPVLGS